MLRQLRKAIAALLLLVVCIVIAGLYNRYFDDSGGVFCGVQHVAAELRNKRICHRTGVDLDVFDLRYVGNPHMILIKYTDGFAYQCFWFDDNEFDYHLENNVASFIESCPSKPRSLIMTKSAKRD